MRPATIVLLVGLLVCFGASGASATVDLFEYAFNIDGAISDITLGDPLPGGVNIGAFDEATGLGTITITLTGAGSHYVAAFFDHEIDETLNTYFNEYGAVSGSPAPGQSWEIDEPGYVFGDIYANFVAGTLDNTNAVPASAPDDVSMAMGWDFTVAPGDTAQITLRLSATAPSGFYLQQTDPDSQYSIYYSGTLGEAVVPVPEPGTLLLVVTGLAGLAGLRRRMKR
jgi:hypothetical protein